MLQNLPTARRTITLEKSKAILHQNKLKDFTAFTLPATQQWMQYLCKYLDDDCESWICNQEVMVYGGQILWLFSLLKNCRISPRALISRYEAKVCSASCVDEPPEDGDDLPHYLMNVSKAIKSLCSPAEADLVFNKKLQAQAASGNKEMLVQISKDVSKIPGVSIDDLWQGLNNHSSFGMTAFLMHNAILHDHGIQLELCDGIVNLLHASNIQRITVTIHKILKKNLVNMETIDIYYLTHVLMIFNAYTKPKQYERASGVEKVIINKLISWVNMEASERVQQSQLSLQCRLEAILECKGVIQLYRLKDSTNLWFYFIQHRNYSRLRYMESLLHTILLKQSNLISPVTKFHVAWCFAYSICTFHQEEETAPDDSITCSFGNQLAAGVAIRHIHSNTALYSLLKDGICIIRCNVIEEMTSILAQIKDQETSLFKKDQEVAVDYLPKILKSMCSNILQWCRLCLLENLQFDPVQPAEWNEISYLRHKKWMNHTSPHSDADFFRHQRIEFGLTEEDLDRTYTAFIPLSASDIMHSTMEWNITGDKASYLKVAKFSSFLTYEPGDIVVFRANMLHRATLHKCRKSARVSIDTRFAVNTLFS